MDNNNVIEVRDFSCKSGLHYLLHNINWTVKRGEHWVVFGLNGSGKTTLLGAVAGFQPYTHGKLAVFGEQYTDDNIFALRKKIGFVSSSFFDKYIHDESVSTVLFSGLFGSLGIRGLISDQARQRGIALLKAFGLDDKMDYPFKLLSKGERQNVLIARALLVQPEILILDEPGTGLDVMAREKTLFLIQQYARETAMTIIYVTHYPEEIRPEFDKCLLLRHGRVFKKGALATIFNAETLAEFFEEPIQLEPHHDGSFMLHTQAPTALYDALHQEKEEDNHGHTR